jgi:hypothetical protein
MDGELFAILLISLVAGYPVGAKLISTLEKQHAIDTSTAKDMYCYCYSGGLAFILGTISGGLKVALIVYISNVFANLLLALLLNFKSKVPPKDTTSISVKISSETLIDSVNSAFKVMVTICTMIVSFSIAVCLLYKTLEIPNEATRSLIDALLEISNVMHLKVLGGYYLPTVSALFSFGGVCVVLQIVTIADKSFSLKRFLQCRLFTSFVSFVVCYFACKIFLNIGVAVGYVYQTKVTANTSVVPSISLLFMSFILLSSGTANRRSIQI